MLVLGVFFFTWWWKYFHTAKQSVEIYTHFFMDHIIMDNLSGEKTTTYKSVLLSNMLHLLLVINESVNALSLWNEHLDSVLRKLRMNLSFFPVNFNLHRNQIFTQYIITSSCSTACLRLKGGRSLTLDHMGSPLKNKNFEKRFFARDQKIGPQSNVHEPRT